MKIAWTALANRQPRGSRATSRSGRPPHYLARQTTDAPQLGKCVRGSALTSARNPFTVKELTRLAHASGGGAPLLIVYGPIGSRV